MTELSNNARKLLKKRYCYSNEEPEDVLTRIITEIGKVSNRTEQYEDMIYNLDFLPNSPVLFNAGHSNEMAACFVIGIEDSIESIFEAVTKMAKIQKASGGTGFSFSKLREKGASISGGGKSTGAISFMKIFDSVTNAIRQGGKRRGASLGVLSSNHPEIIDFIKEKIANGTMKNFNLSVMADDDFMQKVVDNERYILRSRKDGSIKNRLRARDIFKMGCYSAWLEADPGFLFYDTINNNSNFEEEITACNPCSEKPLPNGGACVLGSINLANHVEDNSFQTGKFKKTVKLGTNYLIDVNEKCSFPIPEAYEIKDKYNPIGLGIMGFADMLMKMEIEYDSRESLKQIRKIGKILDKVSKKEAPKSADRTTIAPTGSLSIIADCSSGIEPIYSLNYTRDTRAGAFEEIRDNEYLRTAHQVNPMWHLRVQTEWQKYITSGISKTINLPQNASVEQIEKIYMEAWKRGAKGITIYRDKSKNKQVYYSCEDEECIL